MSENREGVKQKELPDCIYFCSTLKIYYTAPHFKISRFATGRFMTCMCQKEVVNFVGYDTIEERAKYKIGSNGESVSTRPLTVGPATVAKDISLAMVKVTQNSRFSGWDVSFLESVKKQTILFNRMPSEKQMVVLAKIFKKLGEAPEWVK